MAKKEQYKSSTTGPAFGAIFTVVWVFAIGALFALLLGTFDPTGGGVSELRTAAAPLIWPFISLALGVPIIVFVWFGGYAAIIRLADLKNHLEHLGTYASDFDRMAETAKELNVNVSAASSAAAEASNQINSNFEKYENSIAPRIAQYFESVKGQASGTIPKPAPALAGDATLHVRLATEDMSDGEASFDEMHQLANDMFYEALSRRNDSPGRGRNQLVVARGGWNKAEIVRKLRDENRFEPDTAESLILAFEMEASSRRWGRENLDQNEILRLFRKLKDAWSAYQDAES
ncbi:MAG: hypothetical protein KJ871_10370 [Alphaproteobacteria bacterium]|nr:hypothetical protein [Alphaproteobacteria bacterium]MBU2084293.1 hypothetical protein [Alphaproteobacteria bacterium]MBU2143445.1 hypothetical protein [Alphaproteobacteria bacterium]MBU2196152.1 hypothetical protein [Alphaproteobacteria bacterium]